MLPGEIIAAIAGNPQQQAGYQNMLSWIAAGGQHGSYAGMMPNEAVVRREQTPWGEGLAYDAAGNVVSEWRLPRPGEISPYGGNVTPGSGGPSAPNYNPAVSSAAFVPDAYKAGYVAPGVPPVTQSIIQALSPGAAPTTPAGTGSLPVYAMRAAPRTDLPPGPGTIVGGPVQDAGFGNMRDELIKQLERLRAGARPTASRQIPV